MTPIFGNILFQKLDSDSTIFSFESLFKRLKVITLSQNKEIKLSITKVLQKIPSNRKNSSIELITYLPHYKERADRGENPN